MMLLIDSASRQLLMSNGRSLEGDHKPVVKIFNPTGSQTWLIAEMDRDGDTLFGLADLGMGEPEMGYISLAELLDVSRRLPIGLECDLSFKATKSLSEYAREARAACRIVA
ncbi:DUF2958 domain-containing protein [Methylobacterium fujisawaense]|uniref:DUF2958 domain-containing protein n=1 Tax=Methylobacterium fujisawaense TaxID=107400 RepID=UPI003CE9A4FD